RQAILNGEDHVDAVAHLTTLAGYVHWQLTGARVLGVGDASGVFPIDIATGTYDTTMLDQFDELVRDRGLPWRLADILPGVLPAGHVAGTLTPDGARLLDPTGALEPGAPFCPPEGDAGTGMVATNSVAPRTGNVSAGTSIFAMVVLEGELTRQHSELDLVTTPAGDLVAMVHCNNGASELNAWAGIFREFATALGAQAVDSAVFGTLFRAALDGEDDAGGLLAYNYLSGEHIMDLEEGRPLVLRTPGSALSLANFMRAQLFSAFATLRVGMDVLLKDEGVGLDALFAHGGLFRTRGVAQRFLAAALGAPVTVGEIAGEGGAWGIAVLAAFMRERTDGQSLGDYLAAEVFAGASLETVDPEPADAAGFDGFMARWTAGLAVEREAVRRT
ncbi:MAG: ATPase, partial [Actinomycetes bacterium]|nr:ATPase [Actinomycetes bacterium]MDX5379803.1 ATPase [Actinomycetes bacterium]MDX5398229.1 ATPase [Actinomycetes bacterium]MDX5449499.1 ATPase [Actinomycetes bacterium]